MDRNTCSHGAARRTAPSDRRSAAALELPQMRVEAVDALSPDGAVALDPGVGLVERLGAERGGPCLSRPPPRDQAGPLEHLQVPRDRRLAHRKRLGELLHGRLALREAGDDRATGGIGERAEDQAELVLGHPSLITIWLSTVAVEEDRWQLWSRICRCRWTGSSPDPTTRWIRCS